MIIINKTKLDTEILTQLIKTTGKLIKARTSKMVIIVVNSQYYNSGYAMQCDYVRDKKYRNHKWIATDKGYIKIRISKYSQNDFLDVSESIFGLLLHEWGHIRDYQKGTYQKWKKHSRHDSRKCEWYANNKKKEAIKNGAIDNNTNLILNFGIELEKNYSKGE